MKKQSVPSNLLPDCLWPDLAGRKSLSGNTFRNRVPEKPEQPATLIVKKQLAGESPEADKDKEFHFTLAVDGVEQRFTLRPGESKEFEIPAGSRYEVREDDYFQDGYALTLENGTGTALPGGTVTVTATNTYIGAVQAEIKGEKTWEQGGHAVALPESITVRLKNGEIVVEEITVTPDEHGEWHYAFTAPQYDADGKEIVYTVEELPVVGFIPSYDGFNILNTYADRAGKNSGNRPARQHLVAAVEMPVRLREYCAGTAGLNYFREYQKLRLSGKQR